MNNSEFFKMMEERYASIEGIVLPPPIFLELGADVMEIDLDKKHMVVRYPVKERYQNPLQHMQGGIIVALLDNTMGPLSYLVAPPSVTTQMNTSYLRPITKDQAYVEVEATITEQTRSFLFMEGRVYNAEGKTHCLCTATAMILQKDA